MFSERLSFGGVALHLYGETPWQLSPACAPFRTEAAPAAHEIHIRLSDTMPTPPDGTPCSLRTYRWRTGAQRHTLHDHVSDFTYAVTDGNSTELTVSAQLVCSARRGGRDPLLRRERHRQEHAGRAVARVCRRARHQRRPFAG